MKIKAVFDSIIVRAIESSNTHGNIILPDMGKEKSIFGEVISVGPGVYSVTGQFLNSSLKEGDKVLLPQVGPVKIEFNGEEYFGCQEKMVMAIIE